MALGTRVPTLVPRFLVVAVPVAFGAWLLVADSAEAPVRALAERFLPERVEPPPPPLAPAVVQARFLGDSLVRIGGADIAAHPAVAPFYAARQYAPLWTDTTAADAMAAALLGAGDDGIPAEALGPDRLTAPLDARPEADSVRTDLELRLTDGYFRLADALLGRNIHPDSLYGDRWIPSRRAADPAALLAGALASATPAASLDSALTVLRPAHPEYAALRRALVRARADDGTPRVPVGRTLSPGDTSAFVPMLRARLTRTEDYSGPAPPDSLARVYDPALATALRQFEARHGLAADGVVDDATREALNRPGGAIAPLLALNMERWRWLPNDLGDRHVFVNIPLYELALRERDGAGWRDALRMDVVVGSPGRWRTNVFSDTVETVVFNPTWTIPASIQMESYGRVNPRGIVRGPGPGNPLGRVKFVFPNPHGIYLHDTTARYAFERETRAVSHGCIRLHDPEALAVAILGATNRWTAAQVAERFSGPWRTENVDLATRLPVHLVYFTAWPEADGSVRVLPDVYGHDRALAEAMGYDAAALQAARAAAG